MAKTAKMTLADARERAGTARKHLQVAEEQYLEACASEGPSSSAQVSASNAILAGIAASDAICGKALGERANDQDHIAACALLARVLPDGKALSVKLRRLLSDKSQLQYGNYCTSSKAFEMLKNARALVEALSARDF